LKFRENQLFVPLRFVSSRYFESFSDSRIDWDPARNELKQVLPVTLSIPPVQRLADRYRLTLNVPPTLIYQLIDKSPRRLWLRFVRGRTSGSQVLEGDGVIQEIRIEQRRHSADLVLEMGRPLPRAKFILKTAIENWSSTFLRASPLAEGPPKQVSSDSEEPGVTEEKGSRRNGVRTW